MIDILELFTYFSELFTNIFINYFNFLFFEFYLIPPFGVTLGNALLCTLILSVLFRLFISVPNTNKKGGGKRGKRGKSSKKGSSSSSSNSSDG